MKINVGWVGYILRVSAEIIKKNYEIIREKRNDESSKVLGLKEILM
jgi:hypothetical protein